MIWHSAIQKKKGDFFFLLVVFVMIACWVSSSFCLKLFPKLCPNKWYVITLFPLSLLRPSPPTHSHTRRHRSSLSAPAWGVWWALLPTEGTGLRESQLEPDRPLDHLPVRRRRPAGHRCRGLPPSTEEPGGRWVCQQVSHLIAESCWIPVALSKTLSLNPQRNVVWINP